MSTTIDRARTYNLTTFSFSDMMELRSELQSILNAGSSTIEEAGERIVNLFRVGLTDENGLPACVLVRMFKTHPFILLDDELKAVARNTLPRADAVANLRCLVLVATAGEEPAWNSRHKSSGHKAIPLGSRKAIEQAPMISQLFHQLGVRTDTVLNPDPGLFIEMHDDDYNVFFVPTAAKSDYIVAQDFVERYGIQSVMGFGGLLASGDLVATILFSRVPISSETADLFKIIGLNFKLAMLKVAGKPLFRSTPVN